MTDNGLYLQCPPIGEDRVSLVYERIDSWARSNALSRLVKEFGSDIPSALDTKALIEWLLDFSERWDFRKMQREAATKDTGEAARWLLDDSKVTPEQKDTIEESAKALGLIGVNEPIEDSYDYVLILGGARLSCLLRPKLAAYIVQDKRMEPKAVVALGSARPVSDSERDATDSYAQGAATEYDLINKGCEAFFKLETDYTEDHFDSPDNPNSSWKIRNYKVAEASYPLVSMSAPSLEPDKRRANSADTYVFCFSKLNIEPGASLLLVTSEIYVPFQQLEAVRTLALPRGIRVETVGFPASWGGTVQGMSGPTNYLQEIRSAIQSADRFVCANPRA